MSREIDCPGVVEGHEGCLRDGWSGTGGSRGDVAKNDED